MNSVEYKEKPLVSALLPIYNPNVKWLEKCVLSVVNQTYENLELIIVDDGSPQPVEDYVRKVVNQQIPITVKRQSNGGFTCATNTAYQASNGKFVAPIGQDDRWEPTKIEQQVDLARQGFSVIFTDVTKIDQMGDPCGVIKFPEDPSFEDIVCQCFPIYESSLISKKAVGGDTFLDTSFEVAGDWKLWIDIWKHSSITHVNKLLTLKRYHPEKETSRNYDKAVLESEKMIKRVSNNENLDVNKIMEKFYKQKAKTLFKYDFKYLSLLMLVKYVFTKIKQKQI